MMAAMYEQLKERQYGVKPQVTKKKKNNNNPTGEQAAVVRHQALFTNMVMFTNMILHVCEHDHGCFAGIFQKHAYYSLDQRIGRCIFSELVICVF